VFVTATRQSRFNGFAFDRAGKRLKPFPVTTANFTRLKPGANERLANLQKLTRPAQNSPGSFALFNFRCFP
jgi:hypothetical protein